MVSLKLGDGWLLQDLANFVEPVQVTDSDGRVLGLFMPANPEQGKELNEKLDSETDWAEIERRAQCTEVGRTTEEVLANLKSLPSSAIADSVPPGTPDTPLEKDKCVIP